MKISKIYSNKEDIFSSIKFNEGFNVIYAKVKDIKKSEKDSHNLGKTLLISLINYMMLCTLKKGHFLYDHKSLFKDFIFFLEIKKNDGEYITIKREVINNTKISFKFHKDKNQNFINLKDDEWDELNVPLQKAKTFLNKKLNLTSLGNWAYRKGITYFLRDQRDWGDVFMISKFQQNEHDYWKPYLAHILGFDDSQITEKYILDNKIEELENLKKQHKKLLEVSPEEYDSIQGQIEIKQTELEEMKKRVETFNYFKEEIKTNKELVGEIESGISDINENLYNISYEIERIDESLNKQPDFKTENLKILFDELKIHFENNLIKDFENLKKFNQKITTDRSKSLKERLKELKESQEKLTTDLEKLNNNREEKLSFLRSQDTFKKSRLMQEKITKYEVEVSNLYHQLKNLDAVSAYDSSIEDVRNELKLIIDKIKNQIKKGNEIFREVRLTFNNIIKEVLNFGALLSIVINNQGNMDFKYGILNKEDPEKITRQGEGTTYKKLLCAAFDLSVLKTHRGDSFFRFVYHDGVLEGLDNRKKIKFLDLARRFSKDYGIQYILTVIDADLPRDIEDNKVEFNKLEIIKELHDKGKDGRLFKLPIF